MKPPQLSQFTWTVDREPQNKSACKATKGMEMTFCFDKNDPMMIHVTAKKSEYDSVWNSMVLTYEEKRDQYEGIIVDGATSYRYVTMSFDRADSSAAPRIHCYVSERYGTRDGAPDDGSWTAGGQH